MSRVTEGQSTLSLLASKAVVRYHHKKREGSVNPTPTPPPPDGSKKWKFVRLAERPKLKSEIISDSQSRTSQLDSKPESDIISVVSSLCRGVSDVALDKSFTHSLLTDPSSLPARLLPIQCNEPTSKSSTDVVEKLNSISIQDGTTTLIGVTESLNSCIEIIRSRILSGLQIRPPSKCAPPWVPRAVVNPRAGVRSKKNYKKVHFNSQGGASNQQLADHQTDQLGRSQQNNENEMSRSTSSAISSTVVAPLQFLNSLENDEIIASGAASNSSQPDDDFVTIHLQKLYRRLHPMRLLKISDVLPFDMIHSFKDVDGVVVQVQHNVPDSTFNCRQKSTLNPSVVVRKKNSKSENISNDFKFSFDTLHLSRLSTPASTADHNPYRRDSYIDPLLYKRIESDPLCVNLYGGIGTLLGENEKRAEKLIEDQKHALETLKRKGFVMNTPMTVGNRL